MFTPTTRRHLTFRAKIVSDAYITRTAPRESPSSRSVAPLTPADTAGTVGLIIIPRSNTRGPVVAIAARGRESGARRGGRKFFVLLGGVAIACRT